MRRILLGIVVGFKIFSELTCPSDDSLVRIWGNETISSFLNSALVSIETTFIGEISSFVSLVDEV